MFIGVIGCLLESLFEAASESGESAATSKSISRAN
jgi:hypothetical protein